MRIIRNKSFFLLLFFCSIIQSGYSLTLVKNVGDGFLINEKPTYIGRYCKGYKIEGLLLNARLVLSIFDNQKPETVDLFAYLDTKKWDAERSNLDFVKAMSEWHAYGLNSFTINLQVGCPTGNSIIKPKDSTKRYLKIR